MSAAAPRPLKAAAAALLRSGEWVGLAEAEEALAAAIPDADALKVADRIDRFEKGRGRPDAIPADRPGRVAFGRRRAVQDVLTRLVTDGRAEATGAGGGRRWRLPQGPAGAKPKRITLPLSALTFDPRLQMRDGLPGEGLYDPRLVEEYFELVGAALETAAPGEPVRPFKDDIEAVEDRGTFWVYSGFNRGEAFRRAGVETVDVVAYPGRFADAKMRSLRENAGHGKRLTPADCDKAVNSLLDSADLLDRVLEAAADEGGVVRSLAAACAVSHGKITKTLKARGLVVTRPAKGKPSRIVKAPPPPPATIQAVPDSPPAAAEESAEGDQTAAAGPAAATAPDVVPMPGMTEEQRAAYLLANETRNAADRGRQVLKLAEQMGRLFAALDEGPRGAPVRVRNLFRAAAAQVGCPVETVENLRTAPIAEGGGSYVEHVPVWPPAVQAAAVAKLFLSQLEGGEVLDAAG